MDTKCERCRQRSSEDKFFEGDHVDWFTLTGIL